MSRGPTTVGLAALLLVGCNPAGEADPMPAEESAANRAAQTPPPASEPKAPPAVEAPPAAAEAPSEPPAAHPGLPDMNSWQRTAFERGYRDCRAGRYAPDAYPEAYRIGCGAAQEAAAAARR